MKDWRVCIVGIIGIVILDSIALINQVDGVLLGTSLVLVGAICGVSADVANKLLRK